MTPQEEKEPNLLWVKIEKIMDDGPTRFVISTGKGKRKFRQIITASFKKCHDSIERVLNQ